MTQHKRQLYVGGLDESVDESVLHSVFIPFGDILNVQLPLDSKTGEKKGFGFVEFELPEDAAAAMENMNKAELYGRTLHVNLARPGLAPGVDINQPVWANADSWFESMKENENKEDQTLDNNDIDKSDDIDQDGEFDKPIEKKRRFNDQE
eukprot:gb/GECH01012870.1/.p1 GENE.gb/GECH01012870.1/~~gb/GECH01012870.1/.p1  ORF type:complete len:150 (+),score=45.29 gb/GECH01012870.1/:1-450(+)